jgi:hypothetical protein
MTFESQYGFIVRRGRRSAKPGHRREQRFAGCRRRFPGQIPSKGEQTLQPQLRAGFIVGLADTVRIEEQEISRLELYRCLAIRGSRNEPERKIDYFFA